MADYIRRLVSGNKARFKDDVLGLELDLVYVTDQIIIMGYPASGIEGLYRNRREDAVKFLEHRHGKNFWVFNFCPITENSYEADVFEGRVSRYPFPDHHAPPLAIMPLVAREANGWLKGSPDRVAVMHCKAGKGRSGTMVCAYLLSLDDNPIRPRLERSHSAKQWAKKRMESAVDSLPNDDSTSPPHSTATLSPPMDINPTLNLESESVASGSPTPSYKKSFTDALKGVLDLHTARRMKPPSSEKNGEGGKVKQGVSIPSQRRFLYYWALLLAHEAPKHLWSVDTSGPVLQRSKEPRPKVRLTKLKLRMRETSSVKMGIVWAANKVIEKTSMAKGPVAAASAATSLDSSNKSSSSTLVWASLARYDDALVNHLEEWEVYTRDSEGHMGKRRQGSEHLTLDGSTLEDITHIFKGDKWDKKKMVRSFARLGVLSGTEGSREKVADGNGNNVDVYTLRPLSDKRWEGLKHELDKTVADHDNRAETLKVIDENATKAGVSRSEANSMYDISSASPPPLKRLEANFSDWNLDDGVVLDAGREIRIKLYIGQVFMGWLWFVPTFHMPQPPPSPGPSQLSSTSTPTPTKATFLLTRKDLDFPLGLGSSIIDVEIEMEWVVPPAASSPHKLGVVLEPAVPPLTEDSYVSGDGEPGQSVLVAAVQAVVGETAGSEVVREAVEGRQAVGD